MSYFVILGRVRFFSPAAGVTLCCGVGLDLAVAGCALKVADRPGSVLKLLHSFRRVHGESPTLYTSPILARQAPAYCCYLHVVVIVNCFVWVVDLKN